MTTETDEAAGEKVREDRFRRMLERRGYQLMKSRRRDPRALTFGTYQIVDRSNFIVAGNTNDGFGLSLDEVELWLTEDDLGEHDAND